MGSAVTKPLTRRRGKVKANELAENSVICSIGVNANDSCQPSLDSKGISLGDNVKDLPKPNNGKLAASKSRDISQDGVTTDSLKELTSKIQQKNSAKTQNNNQIKARRGLSIFNRCFLSNGSPTPHQTTTLSSKCSAENNVCRTNCESTQIILESRTEGNISRQTCTSPIAETLLNSSGNHVEGTDNSSDVDINSTAALAVHTNGLSPDQIGIIRKQLYTEGFNPAEREGGVAFFIPVTDEGVHPQTDRTTVAERLTKKKRASLSYEERMMLANINRQAQLSKRKEFAVRDIRNVKVAGSTTDMSDRTKQDDDVNADVDASVLNAKTNGTDLNVCCTKKVINDTDLESWVTKKATNDAEYEASFIKKATNDAEFEASVTKKATSDAEFEASFTKKVSNDAEFEASFTKKATSDAEFEASYIKKATSDAEFEASVAKKSVNLDFEASDLMKPDLDTEYSISLIGEEG